MYVFIFTEIIKDVEISSDAGVWDKNAGVWDKNVFPIVFCQRFNYKV